MTDETANPDDAAAEDVIDGTAPAADASAVEPDVPQPAPGEPPVLERRSQDPANKRQRAVFTVPLEVVVCVGRARTPIGDLLDMSRDSLIALDARIDDPVEIRVGDRVIARGDLEEVEDGSGRLGVRLTEIVDMVDVA